MPLNEFWTDLAAGWISGAASVLVVQPVDTTLTRLQAVRVVPGVDGSARAIFQRVIQEGGARALWRGATPMTLVIPIQNSLLFAGYGAGERWAKSLEADARSKETRSMDEPQSNAPSTFGGLAPVFAGGCAGGVLQSFAVSPVELVKIKQQSAGGAISVAARDIAARLGSGVMWRGLGATLLRDGIPHGVWFVAYEWSKRNLESRTAREGANPKSPAVPLAAGAFAAAVAWGVGYPFDTIKTRVQSAALSGRRTPGVMETAAALIREQRGDVVSGLYRGFNLKLLRAVPASAVAFFAYEESRRWIEGGL